MVAALAIRTQRRRRTEEMKARMMYLL